ncbi:LPS export ABC transporter periplasmic protein LptC [Alysiella filiformis]|uniref:Lipopolysaccharide export system protein LptC n=1 Tax=Alysiella filiformis DSM 16848 TaxID=1120981 RepID=A0A286E3Y2_9NEIS|nr:LPS export ABC transporter periplasmic protein LptC [Alysiella filiformis]QMT31049.1 LPS export ABC transporter periplasmic protein LptC [Alysiella filiformis]UBQ55960.1 LPS export ABC transporter periplasmic protein LptC [Alysiella filiformis DSM 16848]SOD65579.1 lipopolysaccharide export system protein LptC [Alysiella filiformis DSM 16848]
MNRFRNLLFPLALALILGGLSAWLERVSEVSVEEVKLDPTKPQYSLQTLHGKRFDEQGWLKEQITADSAWQLPDQKEVFLDNAQLKIHEKGTEQYTVASHQARYHLDNKTAILQNEVVLTAPESASRPAAQVKTDHLLVHTQAQTAQTDAPVEFTYGKSHGSANGLFYDHKSGKLDLPSNVKAIIYDFKHKN